MTAAEYTTSAPSDVTDLLSRWMSIAATYSEAHRMEAVTLKSRHTYIGAPSVVLSVIVGTSIFAAIQDAADSPPLRWMLAILSMGAAALAALVTFYNFAERAAGHRIASEEYGDVVRQLEILKSSIAEMVPADWRKVLQGYSQRLEDIGRRADLPNSMAVVSEQKHELKGAFPGGTRSETVMVRSPKLPREGFLNELNELFAISQAEELASEPDVR